MFLHNYTFENIPKLASKKIDGFRYYSVNDQMYPSVTSVLSLLSKDSIQAWRDSIGHDVANFESRRAAMRGMAFHRICEDYLCNKNISDHKKKILPFGLFNLVKSEIDRIDNICGMETTLFSHSLKLAGRVDCVAEFDNVLSVIDFKSANKSKTPEILEGHLLQETAYAMMWSELTKTRVEQIVTIVSCENGDSQTIIEKPSYYVDRLLQCIENFEKSKIDKQLVVK